MSAVDLQKVCVHAAHYDTVVNHTLFVFNEFFEITTTQKARFLCFFWSSLMAGACHHLRPAAVFYDDRPQAQKAVLSIAGAKIRNFGAEIKFLRK